MKRQRRSKKELRGGFLQFLAMAAATLIPMAVDWGMSFKRKKDEENRQRAENDRIAREDAEYERQQQAELAAYNRVKPQAEARFAAQQEDARRAAEAQKRLLDLQRQQGNAQDAMERSRRARDAAAAEAAIRQQNAQKAAMASNEAARRMAETARLTTQAVGERVQQQSSAIRNQQQSVIQQSLERARAIAAAQQSALAASQPRFQRSVSASVKIGSGSDAGVKLLQKHYGLSKSAARALLASF
jgi:hypothetical protein